MNSKMVAAHAPRSTRLTRHESREQTRLHLREAALPEFVRAGIAASSIDKITEAAGYSRGAFYSNYTSKYELALELVANFSATEIGHWEDAVHQAPDVDHALDALALQFDRAAEAPSWWILNIELRLEAERDTEFRHLYNRQSHALVKQMQNMVDGLCKLAGRADDSDRDYIATVVLAIAQGMPIERTPPGGRQPSGGSLLARLLRDLLGLKRVLPSPHN